MLEVASYHPMFLPSSSKDNPHFVSEEGKAKGSADGGGEIFGPRWGGGNSLATMEYGKRPTFEKSNPSPRDQNINTDGDIHPSDCTFSESTSSISHGGPPTAQSNANSVEREPTDGPTTCTTEKLFEGPRITSFLSPGFDSNHTPGQITTRNLNHNTMFYDSNVNRRHHDRSGVPDSPVSALELTHAGQFQHQQRKNLPSPRIPPTVSYRGSNPNTRSNNNSNSSSSYRTPTSSPRLASSNASRQATTSPHSPSWNSSLSNSHRPQRGGSGRGSGPGSAPGQNFNHGPRTPSDILKTLLRKKACLYEPGGTSYAIALITWLVGKSLALKNGYFTRQELQSGAHHVVGEIIDSGAITRTKVNRCMQIILNSCFHYVIPVAQSNPNDESGKLEDLYWAMNFRKQFAKRAAHDEHLLWTLEHPWDKIDFDEALREISLNPQHGYEDVSPVRTEENSRATGDDGEESHFHPSSLATSQHDDGNGSVGSTKRVVMLCFNDNVNSFEDVWRCHNEFIRDVALTGNLKMTSKEWKHFYAHPSHLQAHHHHHAGYVSNPSATMGLLPPSSSSNCGTTECSSTSDEGSGKSHSSPLFTSHKVAHSASPPSEPSHLEGLPPIIPEFSLDDGAHASSRTQAPNPQSYAAAASTSFKKQATDLDGRFVTMTPTELNKFRTTWCSKRYDHNSDLCAFAHARVNNGWLRRDPNEYKYKDEMCPDVFTTDTAHCWIVNRCRKGLLCEYSHSEEELLFHPDRYKKQAVCPASSSKEVVQAGVDLFEACPRGDSCPYLHPISTNAWRPQGGTHGRRPLEGAKAMSARGVSRTPRGKSRDAHDSSYQPSLIDDTFLCPSMLYVHPAPESEWEKSLKLPGLKSMFRQRSHVLSAAAIKTGASDSGAECKYVLFGNCSENSDEDMASRILSNP